MFSGIFHVYEPLLSMLEAMVCTVSSALESPVRSTRSAEEPSACSHLMSKLSPAFTVMDSEGEVKALDAAETPEARRVRAIIEKSRSLEVC